MTAYRDLLLAIAGRIAEAENRVAQLRRHVERLRDEGSDASQANETLQVISRNLGNLYVEQSAMRRTVWAQKCYGQIPRAESHQARASAYRG
jgi:hypothetical protein